MFDQLGEGVYRRRYESLDLNVGVVVGDDGLLIVDTRASHRQADELRDELRSLSPKPVRWVINTHWHWDHTFGNAVFGTADIWGHQNCLVALRDRGDEMKTSAKTWIPQEYHPVIDEVEITPPKSTFADRASLSIGRRVVMSYHGLGHTDADIIVGVPDADVWFLGDLIEESAPPAFGDSYPLDWPLTLRLAMEGVQGALVPGHGDVVDSQFVQNQHEELVAVAELAARVIGEELSLEKAVGLGPYSLEVTRSALERALEVSKI